MSRILSLACPWRGINEMFDQPEAEVGHRAVGSEDEVGEKADAFEDAVAG